MQRSEQHRPSRSTLVILAALAALPLAAAAQQPTAAPAAVPAAAATSTPAPSAQPPASAGQIAATVVAPSADRRAVSLREALSLAARQGPDVAAARAQAAIAQAGVRRAWTAWQPDVTASGMLDHTSAPQEFVLGAAAAAIGFPSSITVVAANSTYGTLQLTQPLLSAQGIFGPGIAGHAAEAARQGADEAREQVLLATAQSYFALQGIEGLLKAAHDLENVALRREDEAKAQIRAGTAVELQLLRAQSDTAEARLQIANLEGARESLLPVLEALTGEPIQPLPAGSANHLPAASAMADEPWENSFAVKSAIEAVKANQGAVQLDEFLWMPQIAAGVKGSYNSNSAFTNGKNYWYDLTLSASIPLYDHGARYASLHEDDAKLQQAMAQLAAARARAKSSWIGARANLAAAQAALAQAEAQANVAMRAQVQVEASFRAGVATSLDLTDADNKRFTATSAAAQARSVVDQRQAELTAAEGHLYTSMVDSPQQ